MLVKNYRLLKSLDFYQIQGLELTPDQIFILGRMVEEVTQLKEYSFTGNSDIDEDEEDNEIVVDKKRRKKKFKIKYGTLHSGEKLISDKSIILLGNSNPGSYIKSNKNIFVLGLANGTLHIAGSEESDPKEHIVFLETMGAPKVRIGNKRISIESEVEEKKVLFYKNNIGINKRKADEEEVSRILEDMGVDLLK